MTLFGRLLPKIRRRVKRDLSLPKLPRERVLAAIVRLMDVAHIRVGNEEYARTNQSFGLTTMRNRHVEVKGQRIHFRFRGKSGMAHELDLEDRRLAGIVRRCRDLPGQELFQYVDEDETRVSIDSGMVNEYLREITSEDITAKDFRTWHGTVSAAAELVACETPETETDAKQNVVAAIKSVADRLGNRPATCRKYYVDPRIVELYQSGELSGYMDAKVSARGLTGLRAEEKSVLRILKKRK